MCSPSPPPAPDPYATAAAQGAANKDAALTQGHINNPNRVGPSGSQTVTWDGEDPTITTKLSPEEQAIYNQNTQNRTGLGGLAGQGIGSLKDLIGSKLDFSGAPGSAQSYTPDNWLQVGQPLDQNSLPAMPQASEALRQKVIDAQMARNNTAIDKQQSQRQSELVAAGIRPGTEAYQREMDAFNRQRVDARQQAEQNATGQVQSAFNQDMGIRNTSTAEQALKFNQVGQLGQQRQSQQAQQFNQQNALRQQAIQEMLTKREVPLNEITALMSGSQVNPAAMSNSGNFASSQVAPAPIFGALQNQQQYNNDVYNAQVSQSNSNTSALTSAAIMAMMYY